VRDNRVVQQRLDRVVSAGGTAVSYVSVGAGRPLVYVLGWLTHLELSWELPAERALYEALAEGGRLVRYDRAGCGLSAPTDRPASLAFELEQLAAVVATLDEPFDLMGTSMGAPVALAWAAAHPDTVRRLVLYGGWARGRDLAPPGVRDHVLGLVESHWGLGSDVLTDIFAPDADRSTRAEFARYQRACSSAATARALLALSYELDVTDRLGRVRAPTLVVHRAGDRAAPVGQARVLADGIDGAAIATRLCISPRTQRNHVANILGKLRVHSQLQAVIFGLRHEIVVLRRRSGESAPAEDGAHGPVPLASALARLGP